MSSKKYASPLSLELTPSRFLFSLFAGLHLLAMGVIWPTTLSLSIKILLSAGLLLSGVYCALNYGLRRFPWSVRALTWDEHDQWWLLRRDGQRLAATLANDSLVHPGLLILNFCVETKRLRHVALIIGKREDDVQRRLRVRLRLAAVQTLSPDQV
ncbi:MAG: hypothetical protein OEW58_00750 [Gammaproteobacteria bacterium]|nr:hypothetical protein [Gammaproteobacteria bacterium]